MPKIKWDCAEDPTMNNFYKIDNTIFLICSLRCGMTDNLAIQTYLHNKHPCVRMKTL